jgi:hypothetical protein
MGPNDVKKDAMTNAFPTGANIFQHSDMNVRSEVQLASPCDSE